jgi:predicted glycosyltransferase
MSKRILLYSHNSKGLGHVIRTTALADRIRCQIGEASVLIVSGSSNPNLSSLIPEGVDYVKIPSLGVIEENNRVMTTSAKLPESPRTVRRLRKTVLMPLILEFAPQVMIVDFFPQGKDNELSRAIPMLKTKSPRTRIILGLRGIIDSPAWVKDKLLNARNLNFIQRYYDTIYAYTDPDIFRLETAYDLPAWFNARLRYTGYVLRRSQSTRQSREMLRNKLGVADEKLVYISIGGGKNSATSVDMCLQAKRILDQKLNTHFLIVAGPYISDEEFGKLSASSSEIGNISLLKFSDSTVEFMQACDLFIGAAGYNTLAEMLLTQCKALIIPRIESQAEQVLHAAQLQSSGYCETMAQDTLSPASIAQKIGYMLSEFRRSEDRPPMVGGAEFVAADVERILKNQRTQDDSVLTQGYGVLRCLKNRLQRPW